MLNAVLKRLEKSEIKTLASFSLAETTAQMPTAGHIPQNPHPQSARTRKGRPYDAMNFALDIAALKCNKAGLISVLTTVTAARSGPHRRNRDRWRTPPAYRSAHRGVRRHGNYFKAGIAVLRCDPKRLGALQQPLRVAGKDRNGTDTRVALIAPNK